MALLNDINHQWGADLSASPVGDLAMAGGDTRVQQRILRRLLTNPIDPVNNLPPDYIWHPTYGCGLRRFIGSLATSTEIAAAVRGQMLMESGVAQNPAPTVTVQVLNNAISLTLSYYDAQSGQPAVLSFSVSQ